MIYALCILYVDAILVLLVRQQTYCDSKVDIECDER